jgi:signal transduction histidine kinase
MTPERERVSRPQSFGLRLGLWYATLFVVGAIGIVFITYALTAQSLAERDRQIINSKLGEYSVAYERGGIGGLAATVRAEQQTAPERLFVRVVGRGTDALVLSMPDGWDPETLETGSLRLPDGTLVQVGKSSEPRRDLLARFRATLGVVTLSIMVIALTGGMLATRSAVAPIRRLSEAVQRVIETGRTDARVPLDDGRGADDAIGELTELFNLMLDKIEGLVVAMRGALDNVSHDLRTPLTRLRGTAEMALAGEADVARYREALADGVEECDRVLVMLNALMDISEAESGTMQLKREPVDLANVAARAVDLYRDVADAKGVTLVLFETSSAAMQRTPPAAAPETGAMREASPALLPSTAPAARQAAGERAAGLVVLGDPTRLEQVAANLIDNAIKYTAPGGRVEVEVRRVQEAAVLRIRDTGIGIAPDELPRIWDRLFRGDRSRAARGLGLGLSLVKAIVEAHGGTVDVHSEVGDGSTFEVRLRTDVAPPASTLSQL